MYTIRIVKLNDNGEIETDNYLERGMAEALFVVEQEDGIVLSAHIMAQIDAVKLEEVLNGKKSSI